MFYNYNKTPTSQEFLGVECLSLSNSGVNIGVSCENLLSSPVGLSCLLHCNTFVMIALLCNKVAPLCNSCPTL